MLKGKILSNIFYLEKARCGSFNTAEQLVRKMMPNVYRDDNAMISCIPDLGDVIFYIQKEQEENKEWVWRIHLSYIDPASDEYC